jgi:hypothetical protein
MSILSQIVLEDTDIKKLEQKRRQAFIHCIYLFILSIVIVTYSIWRNNFEQEKWIKLILVGSTIYVFVILYSLLLKWNNFNKDLQSGFKNVVQGEITRKHLFRTINEITIGGIEYRTNFKSYKKLKRGSIVKIACTLYSNIILDIYELEMGKTRINSGL